MQFEWIDPGLELRVEAPAKINLYLEIPGERPDGFQFLVNVTLPPGYQEGTRLPGSKRSAMRQTATEKGLQVPDQLLDDLYALANA